MAPAGRDPVTLTRHSGAIRTVAVPDKGCGGGPAQLRRMRADPGRGRRRDRGLRIICHYFVRDTDIICAAVLQDSVESAGAIVGGDRAGVPALRRTACLFSGERFCDARIHVKEMG